MSTLGIITETKVTRRVDLGDYEESWRGAVFDVWVTPTRAHMAEFAENTDWIREHQAEIVDDGDEATIAEMNERIGGWLARTWLNFPTTEEHSAEGEVTLIREHLQDCDFEAWNWLYGRTLEVIREYREGRVKN